MALQRKLVVELVGTFFFVFTIGMAVGTKSPLAPLAIGTALMIMVFAGGHISGGHYNPAVSTAVLMRGKMAQSEWIPYVVAQVVGAVLAGLVVIVLNYDLNESVAVASSGKMLIVEFLFTFALAYVVLNVATARGTEGNSFYGLAIGFTVFAGAASVGAVSGGAFNPAVAIGATIMGIFDFSDIWIYLLADFAGGAAAAVVFLYIEPAEKPAGDIEASETG